jgi:hypothetical protein
VVDIAIGAPDRAQAEGERGGNDHENSDLRESDLLGNLFHCSVPCEKFSNFFADNVDGRA